MYIEESEPREGGRLRMQRHPHPAHMTLDDGLGAVVDDGRLWRSPARRTGWNCSLTKPTVGAPQGGQLPIGKPREVLPGHGHRARRGPIQRSDRWNRWTLAGVRRKRGARVVVARVGAVVAEPEPSGGLEVTLNLPA